MANGALRNLDLNLLPALDALLRERNVTRAAERLGLSQPAVSAALGRLRRHFGDELLYRTGNRYELTPLAEQLTTRTATALTGVQRVFDATPDFDPATSQREFTVNLSDYALATLGDHLATAVAAQAPGVRMRFAANSTAAVDNADDYLQTVDGIVLPHGFLNDTPFVDLYEDSWVCIVSADNCEVGDTLTMDDAARLPWVVSYNRPTAFTPASAQLRASGVEPHVAVVVESFLAIPFLIVGTRRLALLQRGIARQLAGAADIRLLDCPWRVVPLVEAFWWHRALRSDPAHAWLRGLMRDAGAAVTAAGREHAD